MPLPNTPLRIRSQSGRAGGSVVLGWIVSVSFLRPGLSARAEGTETMLLVNPYALPPNPGTPSWTPNSLPLWPPTESTITLPEVSSMCQSATTTGRAGAAAAGRRARGGGGGAAGAGNDGGGGPRGG